MRVHYCDHHRVPLPEGHPFPMEKYARLRRALVDQGVLTAGEMTPAGPAPLDAIRAVHADTYVDAVLDGSLDPAAVKRLGFPWSQGLVQRTLASVGGTLSAARAALTDGIAGNLAGGTHHAHADFGSGYCVFNDAAVAAVALLDEGAVERVLVFDVDVHQGDGTSAIFRDDARVFTASVHGARNFPARKVDGDLDVALPDGTGDAEYLAAVSDALERSLAAIEPDLAFVQGGVDPLITDRFGRMAVTHEGLLERDRLVLGTLRERGVPCTLTLGGGYARPIEATIEAHVGTYRIARTLAEARDTGAPSESPADR